MAIIVIAKVFKCKKPNPLYLNQKSHLLVIARGRGLLGDWIVMEKNTIKIKLRRRKIIYESVLGSTQNC